MWNQSMHFISSETITLKIQIAWWSRAIHCDLQPPQKSPLTTTTHTHAHRLQHTPHECRSVPRACKSPSEPQASVPVQTPFTSPPSSSNTPLNPHFLHSVTSYHGQHSETQNYLQSFWPLLDSGLVQWVWRWGRHLAGEETAAVSVLSECMNAAHLLHYLLCLNLYFAYQTDGEAPLATRHVGLGILQRWTNRAGRSTAPGHRQASVPSKVCFAGVQNSAEIGSFEPFHSLQIDVECPAPSGHSIPLPNMKPAA